jgi:hypothetical protein
MQGAECTEWLSDRKKSNLSSGEAKLRELLFEYKSMPEEWPKEVL